MDGFDLFKYKGAKYMPSQVTNYQCPNCSGPLNFSSKTGKLVCDYCDSSFDVAEIEALYEDKEEQASNAFQSENEKAEKIDWDASDIQDSWGTDAQNMRTYNCPSCGAELICEATTAATNCPYCGNPSIVPGQFADDLKPDYIIPFKIDKNAAIAALKQHYSKKLFLPKQFSDKNNIEKVQGIYVPFWLFNAEVDANYRFEGTISETHREGDYRVTDTSHFDVERSGSIQYESIPTDASKKMSDDYMDSLEPYDYTELKPFSTAYLPGYLADKYDVSIDENTDRANNRCISTTENVFYSDVVGYQTLRKTDSDIHVRNGKVSYALLPVWILNTKWQNKDYMFAMNGQTGKFIGDLPVSRKRFWGFCAVLTVLFSLLLLATYGGRSICAVVFSYLHLFAPILILLAVIIGVISLSVRSKKKKNAKRSSD